MIHGIRIGGKQAQTADDCLAGDRSQHNPDWNGKQHSSSSSPSATTLGYTPIPLPTPATRTARRAPRRRDLVIP